MITRKLSKTIIEERPWEIWNSFIDLIATEKYDDLDPIQQVAHLCFWYDSELQNGGHLQYFENRGTNLLQATLDSLQKLGAGDQFNVLQKASELYLSIPRHKIETVEEFVDTALEGEYDDFDSEYYDCTPEITNLLDDYLKNYRDSFVEITENDAA